MDDPRQAEVLGAVDEEIGRVADLLAERFGDGGSVVLIVTADHGQCPEIDANGGVRIDPSSSRRTSTRSSGPACSGSSRWSRRPRST